jgi:hypothetical protein
MLGRVTPLEPPQIPLVTLLLSAHVILGCVRLLAPRNAVLVAIAVSAALLGLATPALLSKGRARYSVVLLLVAAVLALIRNAVVFPFCPNHGLMYVASTILMLCAWGAGLKDDTTRRAVRAGAGALLASLWFFAGLQKLRNGFWINGDFVGYYLFDRPVGPIQLDFRDDPMFFQRVIAPGWLARLTPGPGNVAAPLADHDSRRSPHSCLF